MFADYLRGFETRPALSQVPTRRGSQTTYEALKQSSSTFCCICQRRSQTTYEALKPALKSVARVLAASSQTTYEALKQRISAR